MKARHRLATGALIVLAVAALQWPAWVNGFPLVFMDSTWYLAPLFGLPAHPGRAPGYTVLLGSGVLFYPSLWLVIVLQAAIAGLLLVRAAMAVRPEAPFAALWGTAALALGGVLLFSGVAKYTSWLMPDFLAGCLFLAGLLFFLGAGVDRVLAAAVALLALVSHGSHVPLALATLVPVAAVAWATGAAARRRVVGALVLVALVAPAASLLASRVVDVQGEQQPLGGASTFLANKLVVSGIFSLTLEMHCDERRWAACQHRAWFDASSERHPDAFLFWDDSPLRTVMGGWRSEEAAEVVRHAFRCCWPAILRNAARDAWAQFWRIDSTDGLDARRTGPMLRSYHETTLVGGLAESDQANDRPVRVRLLPVPEAPLQAILLLLGGATSAWAWRRGERRPAWLFAALVLFLVANASVCAFVSTVHDRYQGRVAWLLPWATPLIGLLAWNARGTRPTPRAVD